MAETTQHRPRTRTGRQAAAEDQPAAGSSTRGLVSLGAGALGVVSATLPSLGLVALALAGIAIGAGVPVMRRGPRAPGFPSARVGVVLGMIGVLVGVLSVAVQLVG